MTQETRHDLRFPVLVVLVTVTATGLAVLAIREQTQITALNRLSLIQLLILGLLLIGVLVAELLDVAIPGAGSMSISFPLYIATAVSLGPAYAGLAAVISLVPSLVVRRRSGWAKLLFNAGQMTMTAMVPGLLYVGLGGTPLLVHTQQLLLPLVVAGVAGTVVNLGLGGLGVSLMHDQPFGEIWTSLIAWMFPSQVVLGFVGLAIAEVLGAVGATGFALFVLPLVVARQTYQQSVRLREAYADTISSLVAALEAKDVYTKGHSMRVAGHAVLIAEAMNLSPDRVRRIEQAALLHDIGKVGISRRVLAKEMRLTESEYEEIKRHPAIGAHIVAGVPYLVDLVPMIEHHHERFDGRGYGDGTVGTDIPIEARILAVADSFDAMTSVRPYRDAMSHEDALRELRDNCGTQFDPDAVAAFERGYAASQQASPAAEGEVGSS